MDSKKQILIVILTLLSFTFLQAQTQQGKASFYSKRATGARTANGERFHHDSLTCAHRTYPFGTKLLVTNPANGKQVVVRVTDRGPFVRGRIIDLSWRAAKEIGIISAGIAMVNVQVYKQAPGIPYKPVEEDEKLPEIDFEMAEVGYSFIPEWQDNDPEPAAAEKELPQRIVKQQPVRQQTASPAQKTASPAPKTSDAATNKQQPVDATKKEPSKTSSWNIFERLKKWGQRK
ncbi:MAG: septal ring lytic transglycosylase RlpA family protein [Prevotella sp.]|nr:septal ring lytic transglycosylase RlpA family protein [Prevotella sp.]